MVLQHRLALCEQIFALLISMWLGSGFSWIGFKHHTVTFVAGASER